MSDSVFIASLDDIKGGEQLQEDVQTIWDNLETVKSFNQSTNIIIDVDDSTFNVNVDITGDENLYIEGDISTNGNLCVNGDSSFNGDLIINGDICLNSNVTISGELTATTVNLEYLNVDQINNYIVVNSTLEIAEDISCGGKINVVGISCESNVDICGNLDICGNVDISGDVTINGNITANTLSINDFNYLTLQNVSISNDLLVYHNVDILSNLVVSQDISAGNLELSNNLIIANNATINNDTFIHGNLDVYGDCYFRDNIILDKAIVFSEDFDVSNNLTVNGTSTLMGETTIESTLNINGGSFDVANALECRGGVHPYLNLLGELFVTGNAIFYADIRCLNINVHNIANFFDDVYFNSSTVKFASSTTLSVLCPSTFSGTTIFNTKPVFNSDIEFTNSVSFDDVVEFTNDVNFTNSSRKVSIEGDLDANTITASSYQDSDDRLKDNEIVITNALETIMKLNPQIYDKYSNLDKTGISFKESGLIAQEIYYQAPELRHLIRLGKEKINGNAYDTTPTPVEIELSYNDLQNDLDYSNYGWSSQNPSSLSYLGLIPYLIKGSQELKLENDSLKSTITNLQTDVSNLQVELSEIKNIIQGLME